MTVYEQPITYYQVVDTPLSEEFETLEPPLPFEPRTVPGDPVQQRMLFILAFVVGVIALFGAVVIPRWAAREKAEPATVSTTEETAPVAENDTAVSLPTNSSLSPIFSPEVRHWEPQILAWSAQHGLDPNLTATVMQIESCGDPQALSSAGAQGLFQVMPFHFSAGEDQLDPNTNASRGLAYLVERLQQTKGDVGKALAGYNGGHVAAAGDWDSWAPETQRYYVWGTGIYEEASSGMAHSPTLQKWMDAGGAALCRQAAQRLNLK